MFLLGDTIALVALSNGLAKQRLSEVNELRTYLESLGLKVILSAYIYETAFHEQRSGEKRGKELESFFLDEDIKGIFDISGGDLANEVLNYLNFQAIGETGKPFFGYSDLTPLLNALYSQGGLNSYLYQLRHLATPKNIQGRRYFEASLISEASPLFTPKWEFVQGKVISGNLIGGNVRCFLKLAGTPYLPDCVGKVLFLESFGGTAAKIRTYFTQLKQMGVFTEVSGILLGTFTELEHEKGTRAAQAVLLEVLSNPNLPVATTREVGHGVQSKALKLGAPFLLKS